MRLMLAKDWMVMGEQLAGAWWQRVDGGSPVTCCWWQP